MFKFTDEKRQYYRDLGVEEVINALEKEKGKNNRLLMKWMEANKTVAKLTEANCKLISLIPEEANYNADGDK